MTPIEQRDRDIQTLATVGKQISQYPDMTFVVSGSYAIEALTRTTVFHNDMDTNIFTGNVSQAMPLVRGFLHTPLYRQGDDRLEYDVHGRRLEIRFIEATQIQANVFDMNGKQVSLVDVLVEDSKGEAHPFKVKSLAYSIATWALRIADVAKNPLRPVRESDLHHLALLLRQRVNVPEILTAMDLHPQMPESLKAEDIYQAALDRLHY